MSVGTRRNGRVMMQRCLILCPGSLAEQWQDKLHRRFHLPFEILTNEKLETARTGNWFLDTNFFIARLDKLSRDENLQEKLKPPDCRWDLIVCDEAHKMSATIAKGGFDTSASATSTSHCSAKPKRSPPHLSSPTRSPTASQTGVTQKTACWNTAKTTTSSSPVPALLTSLLTHPSTLAFGGHLEF